MTSSNIKANSLVCSVVKIISFPSIVFGLALMVIWSYLYRIGRQDLLMDTLTFRDLFSITGVAFILATVLFSLVYYTPSLISALVIKREIKYYENYGAVKTTYLLAWGLTSCTAFIMTLALSWFLPDGKSNPVTIGLAFLASGIVSVTFSAILNRINIDKKSLFMDKKERLRFKVKMHLGVPVAIGMASWVYIFPLLLLLSPLKSFPGESKLTQLADVMMLGGIVLLTSMLPGVMYFRLSKRMSILRQICSISGAAMIVLLVLSLGLPVIPVLLLNFTMKITGTIELTSYMYAVSTNTYPEESFPAKEWDLSKSHDGGFYILHGVSLFSFGGVRLICPVHLREDYLNSMRYVFASREYDNKQRFLLQKKAKECRTFSSGEIKRLSPA